MSEKQKLSLESTIKNTLKGANKKAPITEEVVEKEEVVVDTTTEEVVVEDNDSRGTTLAALSIKTPASAPAQDPKTKIGYLTSILGSLAAMDKTSLVKWYTMAQDQIGHEADKVGDKSEANKSSIKMKPSAAGGGGSDRKDAMPKLNVKEDMEAMFSGQELSEEFKETISTLFESAVGARVIVEQTRLEEEFETKINEEISNITEELTTKLDTYLEFVVENWMEENKVAIESTLRNELMDEFLIGLKTLFTEHYIDVPQDKVDVLEALAEKVEALEAKLNEAITENIELKNTVISSEKNDVFEELASDLTATQQEKFKQLSEGIEFFGDIEVYANKLNIIKENYFKKTTTQSSNITEETFEGDTKPETTVNVDPNMARYVQAIAKTVKK